MGSLIKIRTFEGRLQQNGGPGLLGQLMFFSAWSAIFKMVRHFFVALKTAEMTSKMGCDNVKICASTRADKNVNGAL